MARRDLGVAAPAKLTFCLPTADVVEQNNKGKGQGQAWLSLPADQLLIWGLVLMPSWLPSLEAEQHLGLFVSQVSCVQHRPAPGPGASHPVCALLGLEG